MKHERLSSGMKETIKSFAVDLLGCGCSGEVFDSIEVSGENFGQDCGGTRILIGRRLLIYIVPWSDRIVVPDDIDLLVHRGKEERDRNGYNRFRLVLTADRADELREKNGDLLQSLVRGDEKLHVHILPAGNPLVSGIMRRVR